MLDPEATKRPDIDYLLTELKEWGNIIFEEIS